MITNLEELMQILRLRIVDYIKEIKNIDDISIGKKFSCLHPEHDDKNPSMSLHKNGITVKCFSCDRSADIFTLCSWFEDKPLDGPEFITENVYYLANKFGIKYNISNKDNTRSAFKYAYFRAYRVACDYICGLAKNNPTDEYMDELKKRKWTKVESYKQGLGCVHSFEDFKNVLLTNGFSREFINMVGLNRPDIFNKDSFIFSIFDEYGRPIAFYSRDTKYEDKFQKYREKIDKLEACETKAPVKYNSTSNFTGIYEKQLVPYGIHDCKNFHKVIVTEGHGCRHSLRLNGIHNVIALGGLGLNENTLNKLSSLGVTHIVLLLDNDSRGKDRVKEIIFKYFGRVSMDFSVMDISAVASDVKDPDEFIRKYSIELFKTIQEKDSLVWLTGDLMNELKDPFTVIQEILPLVALERSPINRLKIVNNISDITKIERDIINAEVDRVISLSKDRKSEYAIKIFDEVREMLVMNPSSIDGAISVLESKLGALSSSDNNDELYSSNETLKSLIKLQEVEESGDKNPVILTGFHDFDKHIQFPINEAFSLIMGPPNTGKTAMFNSVAINMLDINDDVIVIIFTNDDSRSIYFNRMVAGQSRLKINWVKNPSTFLNEEMAEKRMSAYKKIADYIRNERLIIKDVEHGNTVEYVGKLIKHYRDKYPNKRIVTFCDNFHRLEYEGNKEAEGRAKYKAMSSLMKSYTTKYDCNVICTVEMTKENMYTKPTDARTIAEAASLQFDANLIIYLWNDLNCKREEATLYFRSTTLDYSVENDVYIARTIEKPIIEGIVLKNKLSEFKGSIYWKFHPELALYEECSFQDAKSIEESNACPKDQDSKQRRAS